MGSYSSRGAETISGTLKSEYTAVLSLFTQDEKQELKEAFDAVCVTNVAEPPAKGKASKHPYPGFDMNQFEKFIDDKVPIIITKRLFNQMWLHQGAFKNPEDVLISLEAFTVTMGRALRGTVEEQSHLIYYLTVNDPTKGVSLVDVSQFIAAILMTYETLIETKSQAKGWKVPPTDEENERFVKYLMAELIKEAGKNEDSKELRESQLQSWLQHTAMFQLLFSHVLYLCFSLHRTKSTSDASEEAPEDATSSPEHPALLPLCQDISWSKLQSLLSVPSILVLNRYLPYELHNEWHFLYSSSIHGASFATFMLHIQNRGPTLVLVKDTDGNVFGGFAADSWKLGPSFTGSSRCFLFSLEPELNIYESSGQNNNHMYLNIDQQTLPNGLAMGGQFDYFGLWLSQDFGKGHSKAKPKCTTYDSPQLSASEDFEIDVLEVWGVGPLPKKPEEGEDAPKSILDKDPEATALLEIAGKTRMSEGLRDNDPKAGIPDVHSLPPM